MLVFNSDRFLTGCLGRFFLALRQPPLGPVVGQAATAASPQAQQPEVDPPAQAGRHLQHQLAELPGRQPMQADGGPLSRKANELIRAW